jgi:hypothetical protein
MIQLQYLQKDVTQVLSTVEANEVCRLLEAKYKPFLQDEIFLLETGKSKFQTQLKCTLAKNDGSVAYPLEIVSVFGDQENGSIKTAQEICYAMIDFVDKYWSEYLEKGRDTFVGIDWETFEFEGLTICMRGFVRNLEVERITEEWLAKVGHGSHAIEPISSTR